MPAIWSFARQHLQDEDAAAIIPWTLRDKLKADPVGCGLCQCSVPQRFTETMAVDDVLIILEACRKTLNLPTQSCSRSTADEPSHR